MSAPLQIGKSKDWKIIKERLVWTAGDTRTKLTESTLRKKMSTIRQWRKFCKHNNYSADFRGNTDKLVEQLSSFSTIAKFGNSRPTAGT